MRVAVSVPRLAAMSRVVASPVSLRRAVEAGACHNYLLDGRQLSGGRPGMSGGGPLQTRGDQKMKTITTLTIVLAGLSLSNAPAVQASDKGSKGAVMVPASDLKWNDVPEMAG